MRLVVFDESSRLDETLRRSDMFSEMPSDVHEAQVKEETRHNDAK